MGNPCLGHIGVPSWAANENSHGRTGLSKIQQKMLLKFLKELKSLHRRVILSSQQSALEMH
jgi:hypothetical protein